jgi:hypothetical protein
MPEDRHSKPRRLQRIARRISFFISLALLAVPLIPFGEHLRGKWALAAIDRKHRAEQRSWQTAAVATTNLADAPIVIELSNALAGFTESLPDFPLRTTYVAPGEVRPVANLNRFVISEWAGGSRRRATTNSWRDLERAVTTNRAALNRLREYVLASDDSVRANHFRQGNAMPVTLASMKPRAGWWLSARCLTTLHAGHADGAVDDIVALIGLAELGREDPAVQSGRRHLLGRAQWLTWETIHSSGVQESSLMTLQAAWSRISCIEATVSESQSEWIRGRQTLRDLRDPDSASTRTLLGQLQPSTNDPWFDRVVGEAVLPYLLTAWAYTFGEQTEAHFAREAGVLLNTLEQGIAERSAQPWKHANDLLEQERRDAGLYSSLRIGGSHLLLQLVRLESAWELQAAIEMTRAAIALERFRVRTGRYPAALPELTPLFLSAPPNDWMSGQPLKYRTDGGKTFVLYSVGWDGLDQGGDPGLRNASRSFASMWSSRDAVWPRPATKEAITKWEQRRLAK